MEIMEILLKRIWEINKEEIIWKKMKNPNAYTIG